MSGSTIGGVVGAVIGFYFGGPTGAQWGWMIGSAVGGYVDPDIIEGPRLTDPRQQTSQEGVPRPIVYGTAVVAGNVIQVQAEPTERAKEDRTGKGGPVQKTYTYTRTVAIRLAEAAPLGGDFKLRRVWRNNKLVYDATGTGDLDAESGVFLSKLRFYSGSETQLPDSALEALPTDDGGGVGNVPAYRGTCYAVIEHDDVTEGGGALNQYMWEISSCASVTPGDSGLFAASGNDAPYIGDGSSFTGKDTFPNADFVMHVGTRLLAFDNSTVPPDSGYSDDFGDTFNPVSVPVDSGDVVGGDFDSTRIYLVGGEKLRISDNSGTSFAYGGEVGSGYLIGDIKVINDSLFFVSTGQDVSHLSTLWFSTDRGENFTDSGISLPAFGELSADQVGSKYVAYGGYVSGATHSALYVGDAPDQWGTIKNPFPSGLGSEIAILIPLSGISALIISIGGVVRRTDDLFDSTAEIGNVGTSISDTIGPSRRWARNGNRIVVTTTAGLFYSDDFGVNWDGAGGLDTRSVSFPNNFLGISLPDIPGYYYNPVTGQIDGQPLNTVGVCQVQLDDILSDLCEREGVTNEDIDVSAVSFIDVRGYPIVSQTSASGAIKKLQEVFFFDFPEWGNSSDVQTKLRAILRGGSSVATIDTDYSVESDDDVTTRAQSVEFPRKLHMMFVTPETLYQPVKETAERETENVKAQGEVTVDTAVIFNRDEGAVVADKALKILWEEAQGRAEFSLPEEYSYLTPSDPISLEGRRYRINETDMQDGELRIKGSRDRASAYTSTATGTENLPVQSSPSGLRGPSIFVALNAPRLLSTNHGPGMYLSVTGPLPAWRGADIYLSIDGGATEQLVATIIDPATMGYLTSPLDAGGSTLAVRLYRDDELDTITSTQADQRFNAFAIQTDSVCEVGQFMTATDTGERTYDLTDLRRGLLGTVADDHASGEIFTLLDGSQMFLPIDSSLAGQELIFRAVTLGTAPENNPTFTVRYLPQFTGAQSIESYTNSSDEPYTNSGGGIYYKEIN